MINMRDTAAIGLILLFIVSAYFVAELFLTVGIGWDYAVHYLNGLALTSPVFYANSAMSHGNVIMKGVYFEPFRAPLTYAIMALLILVDRGAAIYAYAFVVLVILFAGIVHFSKSAGANPLLLASLTITPLVLAFMLINGADILVFAMLVIALSFLLRKSSYFGLFLGLACLAKYPALAFLPLLFFLREPKKIAAAIILFILVTIPWLAFNAVFFGSPLYSYTTQFSDALINASKIGIMPVVLVSFAYAAAAALLALAIKARNGGLKSPISPDRRHIYAILGAFLALAAASFVLIAPGQLDFANQMRFTFLMGFGAASIVSVYIGKDNLSLKLGSLIEVKIFPQMFFAGAVAVLAVSGFFLSYASIPTPKAEINSAYGMMQSIGIENCAVVSNAWVWLDYYGSDSLSPYYYNAIIAKYPIIMFNDTGVPTAPRWISNSTLALKNGSISIYLPQGYVCSS